jgi:hypothetical protein
MFVAIYVAPVVLVIAVIVLWRNKRALRRAVVLWLAFESCNGYLAYRDLHYYDGIDSGPKVVRSDIVGTWRRGDENISFVDDGSFVTSAGARGSWEIHGGLTAVEPSGMIWMAMRQSGQLFLVREPRDSDPDGWNVHARFFKSGPPSRPVR